MNKKNKKILKYKKPRQHEVIFFFGGGRGTRTRDPLRAGQML